MAKLKQKYLMTDATKSTNFIAGGGGSIFLFDRINDYKSDSFTVDETIKANKYVDIQYPILDSLKDKTFLIIDGVFNCQYETDFTVINDDNDNLKRISWNGYNLESSLDIDDRLQINYKYIGDTYATETVEVFTLTEENIANNRVILQRPVNPLLQYHTVIYIPNGPIQLYSYDFNILSDTNDLLTIIDWTDKDLSSVLNVGDIISIKYKIGY